MLVITYLYIISLWGVKIITKKIAILATDGFEDAELLYPKIRLKEVSTSALNTSFMYSFAHILKAK